MNHRRLVAIAAVTIALPFASGCATQIYSPPARALPLEAPRVLAAGETSIGANGGRYGALLGPSLSEGGLQARHGFGHGVEGSLDGALMRVDGSSSAGTSPDIEGVRAGAKVELFRHHLSLSGGLGGGSSAGGGFVSPDLSVIAGYDNRYVVPFASFNLLASVPVSSRPVDVTGPGSPVGTTVSTPELTFGVGSTLGLRLKLGEDRRGIHGALFGGLSYLSLRTQRSEEGFVGLSGGGELIF